MVIEYASMAERNWTTGFYRIELNDKIHLALRVNDRIEITRAIQEVFDYVRQNRISVDYAYAIIMGLVSICLSFVTEMGESITNVMGEGFAPYAEIKSKSTLEAAFEWLFEIYERTLSYFDSHRATRAKQVTESVKEYIKQNYMDSELSVDQISRFIFLDPSYIRKLFAKEMKMNITDYVTSIRMQKAKELLNSSDIRHSEIADLVGYSDPTYFSKSFKKFFGMAPSEYFKRGEKVIHVDGHTFPDIATSCPNSSFSRQAATFILNP